MRKFDTKVQHLKYKVLREVAIQAWNDTLIENIFEIPKIIIPGNKATMRCCVYKERAILADRIKLAMGGNKDKKSIIEVIETACDECPIGGYEVTDACRGCLANRCEDVCPRDAITFDRYHVAHIDKEKCVDCGACAKVCPFTAIVHRIRPCQSACKVHAISMNEHKVATIDHSKCINCGACVYQCPFGAISDKSYIVDAIDIIKKSDDNKSYKVYAVVAPSIASQFTYAKHSQVFTGLKEIGFHSVVEAAFGADLVAYAETQELVEKGFLTSSCCPAFVAHVHKAFPQLNDYVSHNVSPMVMVAKYLKEKDATSKVVFIGPCTAKKAEVQQEEIQPYVDIALTFEELQALFDSKHIDITSLHEEDIQDASYYGRIFGRSGGLSEAVSEGLKELKVDDFEYKPVICNGIEDCNIALLKKNKNILDGNFIEGMACVGGCIGGAGCLTHGVKSKVEINNYSKEALDKTITEVVNSLR